MSETCMSSARSATRSIACCASAWTRARNAAVQAAAASRPSVSSSTQASFDRHVARNDLPVVVDFWAPWCGPCRTMAPAYEQAAARLEPRVRLAKLDTEAEPEVAARFGIRGIPTLIAFKGGRETRASRGRIDLGTPACNGSKRQRLISGSQPSCHHATSNGWMWAQACELIDAGRAHASPVLPPAPRPSGARGLGAAGRRLRGRARGRHRGRAAGRAGGARRGDDEAGDAGRARRASHAVRRRARRRAPAGDSRTAISSAAFGCRRRGSKAARASSSNGCLVLRLRKIG